MRFLFLAALLLAGVFATSSQAQSICPNDFVAFRGTSAPLACSCSAEAAQSGVVYGMDVYSEDSSICQSAMHAGVIPAQGGTVAVLPAPGQKAYPGATRNGVTSSNGGQMEGSFRFAAAAQLVAAPAQPAPAQGSVCPNDFVAFRGTSAPLACTCSAEAAQTGVVYGMDVYSEDSSICQSAVHAGVISAQGGTVAVMPAPGQKAYPGATRNGVTSSNGGQMEGSFRFGVAAAAPAPQPVIVQAPAPAQPMQTGNICPNDFVAFRGTTAPLACSCSAEAAQTGVVYGMDVYSEDSSICQSAVHAGVISAQGGAVAVMPAPGQKAYPGATRNGVTSSNGGQMEGSFRFGVAAAAAAPAPQPAAAPVQPAPAQSSVCPNDFVAFRGTSAPLACSCSAEAAQTGVVYGMDVYSEDSSICQSAVHAGVIPAQGGNVAVIPAPGQATYPGATRNGVTSANGGHMDGSFRFAAAAAPVVSNGVPAQQPIAATLQQTGQVQLYINFAFDSAELFSETGPVLDELLATLRADPNLRLALVGHTDSVGKSDYNMTLSAKRAEAVKFWLVQRGVLPSRLETSGKGASEPIGDNATDYGRALNRRVQALRLG